MDSGNIRKMTVFVLALVCVPIGYAKTDKLQLQAKLSKDIQIQLKDVTITEALEKIGQKANVKFTLSDQAAWKLPYGEATRLSVVLNGPLADSMTEMLNAFFMRYAVDDEKITIHPRDELDRILGRPTTKQLELLKAIYTQPMGVYYIDQVQKSVNEALGQELLISPIHVHAQLNNLLRQLVGKSQIVSVETSRRGRRNIKEVRFPEPNESEPTQFYLPTPITLAQLFKQIVIKEHYGTTWYISEMAFPGQIPEIRVVSSDTFRNLRFSQKIDISYKDTPLDRIFQDLASRAGVRLDVHSGSHLHEHKLSVNMQNIEIGQAVRNIAASAGIGYESDSSRLIIDASDLFKEEDDKPEKSGKTTRAGYVGKISIPMDGGNYYVEFMLRESDLTEDLKKLRAEKMQEVLGKPAEPKPEPKK